MSENLKNLNVGQDIETVKKIREITGASIYKCKEALRREGSTEKAIDYIIKCGNILDKI